MLPCNLTCTDTESGLNITFRGRKFSLQYPPGIWESYPRRARNFLIDNLAFLETLDMPLVSGMKELKYNTTMPFFYSSFRKMVVRNIPQAVEDSGQSTEEAIRNFRKTKYSFSGTAPKKPYYKPMPAKDRVIIPFSCGKDSLLTLAVCMDIGLEPVCVYINDTVSGTENEMKLRYLKKISREFGVRVFIVRNEIENLNDFEFWDGEETCIGYSHMIAGFCLIALPFLHLFRAKYIVLGSQHNMNYSFINKDGYLAYPSFEQSRRGTIFLNRLIMHATEKRAGVTSFIDCLTNIAILKILNSRYEDYAKYEISCDALNAEPRNTRWCCNCSKCARLSLMMRATGTDPALVGMDKNMLGKNSRRLYSLFKGKESDSYEKSRGARDEQLLSFLLALRNGSKGKMIDAFKQNHLKEARRREKELVRKFLTLHYGTSIPQEYREKILSIYAGELRIR